MSNPSPPLNHHLKNMLGVVGGGQLAQMLVDSALQKRIDIAIQTVSKSDPAAKNAKKVFLSDQSDVETTKQMSSECACITFENEWVNTEKLMSLEKEGIQFIPRISSISALMDKSSQRSLLQELNIPAADWLPLSFINLSDTKLPNGWNFPLMAKASRGGYDGKGTKKINDFSQLHTLITSVDSKLWFLEKWVEYEKEYSIVASRDLEGSIKVFSLVETQQYNQVCDWVLAPADVSHSVEMMAFNIVASLLSELNYFGVIAIEFFYGKNGLLVNEIAPRTHNSGHYSIEACQSSQFDHQVCIAAGLPVPSPKMIVPGAIMINLLGQPDSCSLTLESRVEQIKQIPGVNLHWYEKKEEKPGRKLGHVTFVLRSDDFTSRRQEAMEIVEKIRLIWPIK
ncbi:5-(carboxyamino)imidazole ribonucleotide synthase [Prochlorococcus sp. MIT 1223]|uniref:5-(carboxyamino)imidazole ribonucleotide synthase n=1 Tax=Prochlorococcus sp. MIT 1223 TaxID=3096217 RepID=UPI002A7591AE|nr:5-(carboxyamino)imidazole ribonucleotide synthase [Prochlorococcus sp. MIT 1223]